MNEIEKLIQELCPDGVEYRRLLSVSDVLYGYPCDASKFNDNQLGSPLARIRDVLDGYTKTYTTEQVPEKYILRKNDLLIGMDGNFHVANWKMDGGILCQRVCKIYSNDNEQSVLNGYLSHLLKPLIKRIEESKPNGTVKHLLDRDLKELEIPLPPITIQEKIVEILDKFTSLEAELEAELEARRKQYEYYREKLLNTNNKEGIIWLKLGDICSRIKDGSHYSPKSVEQGYYMPSVKDMTSNGFDYSSCKMISEEDYHSLVKAGCHPVVGDVLIAKDGSMLKNVFPINKEDDIVVLSSIAIITPIAELVNGSYLSHYLRSESVKERTIRDFSSKGGVPRIILKNFKRIPIPLPPLSEQRRIVEILDRFEALTNDLQAGLPAEIAARRKQYEYYREKLLTFKRKTV